MQGSYVSEDEVKSIADFIREKNEPAPSAPGNGDAVATLAPEHRDSREVFDEYLSSDDGDELYDEAITVVREAQKASASLLQRRLKVGYARAARLLDLMEANGVVGPGEGAKPRDILIE